MKNSESISNNQDNQATNEWEQALGNYSKNEPTAMDYMREDLEDLERSNHYGRLESDYDDKIKARTKAIQAERDFWKNAPKTALDYAKEDLDELEGDNYYGQLRTDYDKKMKERDERVAAERAAWENAKPTALDYMKEDLEDLQYGPLESGEGTSPSPSKGSKPQMMPKSQATQHSKQPIEPKVSTFPPNSQDKSAEPTTNHTFFESANLKWPEETPDQKMDKAMDQAETAIDHADDVLEDQKKQNAEKMEADEINEINRVIAEMAYSGDEKLVNLMRQKEYESDEDHKNRLVMMAKTEIKWRQLKKSIEDARKHMAADNEAMKRIRASLAKSREAATTPRRDTASAEPLPSFSTSAPEIVTPSVSEAKSSAAPTSSPNSSDSSTDSLKTALFRIFNHDTKSSTDSTQKDTKTEQAPPAVSSPEKNPDQKKILKRDLANQVREVLKNRGESSPQPSPAETTIDNPQPTTESKPPVKSFVKAESDSQPEKKILKRDLKDILRAKIAEREASPAQAESDSQPEKKILQKDLKDILMAKIAEREASTGSNSSSSADSRNEKLRQAKASLAEYQRRIEHVDDSLNAERDKLMEERSPSIRRKLTKIFTSLAEKRKEKARKRAEKRRQEEAEPWLDD